MNAYIAANIHLASVTAADADALAQLVRANLAHFDAYLPAVAALGRPQDARSSLLEVIDRAPDGDLLQWHIFDGQVLCGSVRLKDIDPLEHNASIGYFIGAAHQGRGIATAAVRAVLAYGFGQLQLNRIELVCATGNAASTRLADRLGFVRVGVRHQAEWLHGACVDHFVYTLLRHEFAMHNGDALPLPTPTHVGHSPYKPTPLYL